MDVARHSIGDFTGLGAVKSPADAAHAGRLGILPALGRTIRNRTDRGERLGNSRRPDAAAIEEKVAHLARRQHAVVTRAQLLGAGMTPDMVDARVRRKRLYRLHRGVYVVGPVVPGRAKEMGAVLACGPGALVSHHSAAGLTDLMHPQSEKEPVDVSVCGADRGRRPGIRPHRVAAFDLEDATTVDGIPVTTPARTLCDLAGVVDRRTLEQALARAERRGLVDREQLAARLDRGAGRRGARVLRALLAGTPEAALTRSAAEERLLTLVRRAGLPAPETNAPIDGLEVDFLWRAHRIAVEVDGFAHHRSRAAFELDRQRDTQLAGRGVHVVRVTWRQIVDRPDMVLARLAATLALAEPR